MVSQEESIMLNKDRFLNEIDRVFYFLDTNKNFYPDETERGQLLHVQLTCIQNEIE